MRQIVLDTETTGIGPEQGHKIIEIGCIELVERKLTGSYFHEYINPGREIDAQAQAVHGISSDFLADKPFFSDIAESFITFISDSELIIHNAPFDVGFIDKELSLLDQPATKVEEMCKVIDTLAMAREKHPGQKNSLDALCRRYGVDNSSRTLHGALLDAEILADVFLLMTGGQAQLKLARDDGLAGSGQIIRVNSEREPLPIVRADQNERTLHEAMLDLLDEKQNGRCAWRSMGERGY